MSLVEEQQDTARAPQRVEYASGESIFEQGTHGELVYTIGEGEVDIVRVLADGAEEHLVTLHAGQYFGELGPILGFPRSASARARTDVVLTAYSARDFRIQVLQQEGPQKAAASAGLAEPPTVVLEDPTAEPIG